MVKYSDSLAKLRLSPSACGFQFGEIGFGGMHVHLRVNVPKRDSIEDATIMLKSRSARRMFEQHPGFRKRYPRGSFWSGYEHHESAGRQRFEESAGYIRSQPLFSAPKWWRNCQGGLEPNFDS